MHAEPAVQRLPDQDQLPAESVLDDVTRHAALSACGAHHVGYQGGSLQEVDFLTGPHTP
jgi:hypothetical protein